MHIQYASLVNEDSIDISNKSKESKTKSSTKKPSNNSNKKIFIGKSFQKVNEIYVQ